MAEFKPNVPVVQDTPNVTVEIKRGNALPPGKHRFQLIVVDDQGNESEPDTLVVIVRDSVRPTAVLELIDKNKAVIDPAVVPVGKSFLLSAALSKDADGSIKEYRITLLSGNR
ncbi:MAG: hypothetical protein V3V15_01310 [Sphingorhabdus sp.]